MSRRIAEPGETVRSWAMMLRHLLVASGLLIASCTDGCSCGDGESEDSVDPAAPGDAGAAARPPAWKPPARDKEEFPVRDPDFKPIDAGAKAGTIHDREGGHFAKLTSPDLPRFQALQKKLTAGPVKAAKLVGGAKLGGVLPTKLGEYEAVAKAVEGPTKAGRDAVVGRTREYRTGSSRMIVKITDTGQAPRLREDYVRRLTLQGDVSVGKMRPAVVGDQVVLESFFLRGRSSWATGLVGGRYLVEVRARNVQDERAASKALEKLKLSGLGN